MCRQALERNRFPAFCGSLIGLFTLLQRPILESLTRLFHSERRRLSAKALRRLARFLAALIAASFSFTLLNKPGTSKPASTTSEDTVEEVSQKSPSNGRRKRKRESKIPPGLPSLPPEATLTRDTLYPQGIPLAGRTIDLTLFAVIRAADVVVQSLRRPTPNPGRISRFVSSFTTPFLFAASSATIMHAFFYKPSRLPYSYVSWIERIAGVDSRIIEALRHAYYGNFVYGKETGIGPLLGSLCKELGLPEEWGDPAKTIPVPCDIVHQGTGPSCEKHFVLRFWRGFLQALGVYAPLQAILLIRKLRQMKTNRAYALLRALREAGRSSAFLGAFIALFYLGVCTTRTKLPKAISRWTISAQAIDSGLAIGVGCLVCGWSILLEPARRQMELSLFVLPRAVAVWFPRRYPKEVSSQRP